MRLMNVLSAVLFIAICPIDLALGADTPVYKDGLLIIPSVNTAELVGQYQDVSFKLTEQGGWQLLSVKAIGTVIGESDIRLVPLTKVEVIKTDTFPTQVFLRLSGSLGGCFSQSLGQINQRLENNRFEVVATASYYVNPYYPTLCPTISTSFVRTIPLAVYGLSAGTYSYDVNGTTGTFALAVDNKYAGDY